MERKKKSLREKWTDFTEDTERVLIFTERASIAAIIMSGTSVLLQLLHLLLKL